jgi:cellulose biosynthesis protein BcsQ
MKIAVINTSGNVGKTTISRHLLQHKLKSEIISVETINSDGLEDAKLKGEKFSQLIKSVGLSDSIIVDIGASQAEDFLDNMEQQVGSHDEFDYFVIPTIAENKQLKETTKTVDMLSELGVEKDKIKVLFNKVKKNADLQDDFERIYEHYKKTKSFTICDKNPVRENELYDLLNNSKRTMEDVLTDGKDYKELMKSTDDVNKKVKYSDLLAMSRLALHAEKNLNEVFNNVFGESNG